MGGSWKKDTARQARALALRGAIMEDAARLKGLQLEYVRLKMSPSCPFSEWLLDLCWLNAVTDDIGKPLEK